MSDLIKLSKDGNLWCALIGDDLHVGIAGFGLTPLMALQKLQNELRDCSGLTVFEETFRDCTIDAAMVRSHRS